MDTWTDQGDTILTKPTFTTTAERRDYRTGIMVPPCREHLYGVWGCGPCEDYADAEAVR
jgi:hypothetical protein